MKGLDKQKIKETTKENIRETYGEQVSFNKIKKDIQQNKLEIYITINQTDISKQKKILIADYLKQEIAKEHHLPAFINANSTIEDDDENSVKIWWVL